MSTVSYFEIANETDNEKVKRLDVLVCHGTNFFDSDTVTPEMSSHLFTSDQVKNSPSSQDGISEDKVVDINSADPYRIISDVIC
jgi:hypothetical protein